MSGSLLTKRQKEVLRYRWKGMTQQEIADLLHTSTTNIYGIEKDAMRNIRLAKDTLAAYAQPDIRVLCTLPAGSDLVGSIAFIRGETEKAGIPFPEDPISFIIRLRAENPDRVQGNIVKEDIQIFLNSSGELFS